MKQQKIRGHNRLQKQIEIWRVENLVLNLDYVKINGRGRIEIVVHPWCDISIINSSFPEPYGKTKQKILNALLDIYESWRKQLDNLNEPYYLKIWLFEPRFSKSQVVCAIGDNIDFYEHVFYKPQPYKPLVAHNYGNLKKKLSNFNWEYRLDEDHYENDEVGEPESYASRQDYEESKKWFRKILKKPHRTCKLKNRLAKQ